MQGIAVRDRDAGLAGLSLEDLPYPHAAENDVIVRVLAAGLTRGELAWPGAWTDRGGRDRTPSVRGHEVSGVVAELGYGTTGLTVGQRVFGLADWSRNGTLAEYVAMEARNLAPLPAGFDRAIAAGAVISGLTAWHALFGRRKAACYSGAHSTCRPRLPRRNQSAGSGACASAWYGGPAGVRSKQPCSGSVTVDDPARGPRGRARA
jgi:NADPH:quinone reductase-like Zn-dependent oxidoreductase